MKFGEALLEMDNGHKVRSSLLRPEIKWLFKYQGKFDKNQTEYICAELKYTDNKFVLWIPTSAMLLSNNWERVV